MMSIGQQMRLFDWLPATPNTPQVVSISSVPLRPLVDDGRFLEGLFYRLNVIYLDATPCENAGLVPGGRKSRTSARRCRSSVSRG